MYSLQFLAVPVVRTKELAGIPHHSQQLENLSFPSPVTTCEFSGFRVLSKARLKVTHMRGLLLKGSDLYWYLQGTFRPLDEKH